VHDSFENGQKIKFLTVIEEYTRYCLCIEEGSRFTSKDVMIVLERLFAQYGYPTFIRNDNGPEFIANALSNWLSSKGVTTRYCLPGLPMPVEKSIWLLANMAAILLWPKVNVVW